MSPPFPHDAPTASAVDAFLRGVERRAWVLADAQCGSPRQAEIALAAAMMRFRHAAPDLAMTDWPLRFWSQLLARPELRAAATAGTIREPLAGLSPGPRAILLLRLVAGLDEQQIAEVLSAPVPAVRLSLARALQHLPEPGAESARALHASLQAAVRALPGDRARRLQTLREASQGRAAALPARPRKRHRPRLVGALWAALALVVIGFFATFWLPPAQAPLAPGEQRELPQAPPMVLAPEAAALASPDFDDALEPGLGALADDLLFYSWLAAQQEGAADAQ